MRKSTIRVRLLVFVVAVCMRYDKLTPAIYQYCVANNLAINVWGFEKTIYTKRFDDYYNILKNYSIYSLTSGYKMFA